MKSNKWPETHISTDPNFTPNHKHLITAGQRKRERKKTVHVGSVLVCCHRNFMCRIIHAKYLQFMTISNYYWLLQQIEITTNLFTFSLLLYAVPSLGILLYFIPCLIALLIIQRAHIVSIHLWTIFMIRSGYKPIGLVATIAHLR